MKGYIEDRGTQYPIYHLMEIIPFLTLSFNFLTFLISNVGRKILILLKLA